MPVDISRRGRLSRVLIVSPHFPPINAPDMQRVRMSLPYFREFGWEPYVLAVAPDGQALDPLLMKTIPPDVPVERVRAVPGAIAKFVGIGNIALRALPFLQAAGSRLIKAHDIDLVYFSTTMFLSMPLGRVWRRRFGVPYVLDIQDPWVTDYYERHPGAAPPPKYAVARRVHGVVEAWTMKDVSALIAVSDAYVESLRARYPWLGREMCTTLPFGASTADFDVLDTHPQSNRFFQKHNGRVNGVYVGRCGDPMRSALRILFRALQAVVPGNVAGSPIRLHFIGTDYAADHRAHASVEPVARDEGVEPVVGEHTGRVPYFEALQLMKDADFLILVGSDDPGYTASKVYPYLAAGKPILAVVHERSSLVEVLRQAPRAELVTFTEGHERVAVENLAAAWRRLLDGLGSAPAAAVPLPTRYSAREMTRRQAIVFDDVMTRARTCAA